MRAACGWFDEQFSIWKLPWSILLSLSFAVNVNKVEWAYSRRERERAYIIIRCCGQLRDRVYITIWRVHVFVFSFSLQENEWKKAIWFPFRSKFNSVPISPCAHLCSSLSFSVHADRSVSVEIQIIIQTGTMVCLRYFFRAQFSQNGSRLRR